jgi:hypothetical protein
MRTRKAKAIVSSAQHAARQSGTKTQTTLRLPRKLYERAQLLVERQKTGSMNDFIVSALSAYVRALERKAIDEAFAPMAHDKEYQRETLRIMREFAASDAETIALSERDLLGV